MDNKKKQLIIAACLIAVFILIFLTSVKTITEKNRPKAAPPAAKIAAPSASPNAANSKVEPSEPQNFEGPVYRDPFKRQASAGPLSQDSKKLRRISSVAGALVSGIVYDKEHIDSSYCIINGEILKVNESVDDFTVTGIKDDEVTLKNNKEGKEYKLKLWEDEAGSL